MIDALEATMWGIAFVALPFLCIGLIYYGEVWTDRLVGVWKRRHAAHGGQDGHVHA